MVAAVPPIIEPILESVSFLVTYLLEHVSLIRIAPKLVILV